MNLVNPLTPTENYVHAHAKELDELNGVVTIRGEKYLRSDNSHVFAVLLPIFRQAYLKALRLRKSIGVSTNLVEMSLFAPFVPFCADYSDTTIYFNELPGQLGRDITRVAEDKLAKNVVVVNAQLIDRLEVQNYPGYHIIRYLGDIYAFEFDVEQRIAEETENVEETKKTTKK